MLLNQRRQIRRQRTKRGDPPEAAQRLLCGTEKQFQPREHTPPNDPSASDRGCGFTVCCFGAGDGTRTRDNLVGNERLYQLSYSRTD